jgi:predicted nucleic acid-binding Zn ribbon protein
MPVYVYKNLTTGATFEVEQRITESALSSDPVTGDPVKRLVQPVGIAFKGTGFYVNDSRGKKSTATPASPKAEGAKGDAGAGDSGSGGAAKSEPTPATAAKPAASASATD